MAISHADLFRLLPLALGSDHYRIAPGLITVMVGKAVVRITFSKQRERRLGALVLPVTYVEFDFQGYTTVQVQAFIERFDRCYRRGGG